MKRTLVAATFATALCLVPGRAVAETGLVSAPLKGGAGGAVCACTNLTGKAIEVDFLLVRLSGGSGCAGELVYPDRPTPCEKLFTEVVTCTVFRSDGKPLSTKQLPCTLSSIDANGSPTAVVPVDKKLKR
jgi:hypothetical protein